MKTYGEILASLQDVEAHVEEFKSHAASVSGKLDLILVKLAELKQGGGATPEQLAELESAVGQISASVTSADQAVEEAEAKADEALAEPAPEPAPAPEEPQS